MNGENSGKLFELTLAVIGVVMFVLVCTVPASAQNARSDASYITIASEIASAHNWSMKYNCRNFAWDLSQSLTKEGYQVKIQKGRWLYLNGTSCNAFDYQQFRCKHSWVLVKINNSWIPIEATRGYVIPLDVYKKEYK